MIAFSPSRLAAAKADLAWPLVRATASGPTIEAWRDHVARLEAGGGGLIAVCAEDGLIHGIAGFRPLERPWGRVLAVDPLVTFELRGHAPARTALRDALERIAGDLGCSGLSFDEAH